MKYIASALALALGLGMAVAAQAQGTTPNASQPSNNMPSAQTQPAQMQQQPQIKKQRHARHVLLMRHTTPQRKLVIARSHPQTRTARLANHHQTRVAHARMPKSETTGVGSSTPNKPTPANTPVVNPSSNNAAPVGAGSTTPPS